MLDELFNIQIEQKLTEKLCHLFRENNFRNRKRSNRSYFPAFSFCRMGKPRNGICDYVSNRNPNNLTSDLICITLAIVSFCISLTHFECRVGCICFHFSDNCPRRSFSLSHPPSLCLSHSLNRHSLCVVPNRLTVVDIFVTEMCVQMHDSFQQSCYEMEKLSVTFRRNEYIR